MSRRTRHNNRIAQQRAKFERSQRRVLRSRSATLLVEGSVYMLLGLLVAYGLWVAVGGLLGNL